MAEPESLREFEFLPNLPKSNLDDRTFNDLVQECILRIPRYCPEWTNHNPGDPGITLIELFAWLTDQMLFRFNQVPRRYYVAFLELLGIRLRPPNPAQTELTFYLTRDLTRAQAEPSVIAMGTEVATVRTETEEAVVFTTDRDLIIGQPRIKHLFTAQTSEPDDRPHAEELHSPFAADEEPDWAGLGNLVLFETCEPGNCFYLVLETAQPEPSALEQLEAETDLPPRDSIAGNVLAFTFRGNVANTTNILPDNPPLQWQAWDGETWVNEILRPQDDHTNGFSFSELGRNAPNPEVEGADVILHLPTQWQPQDLAGYRGYWIRCVYLEPNDAQYPYQRSPEINSVAVRSIGGTVSASECTQVEREFLGVSTGKPGQTFQLQGVPVLVRRVEDAIEVTPPGDPPEIWKEVADFGNSEAESPHYHLDSQTGTVQFGPLVRESSQLLQQTQERSRHQPWGKQVAAVARTTIPASPLVSSDAEEANYQERQYGRIPPIGAEITMVSYRVGGGSRGNVEAGKLMVLKKAIPYVKQVTNLKAAQGGKDGESLDQAVMQVPAILRTAKTAVIPEDFETIAKAQRSIYRAYCPPCDTPGLIRLLVTPDPRHSDRLTEADFRRDFPNGLKPDDHFWLKTWSREARRKLELELEERKPLGVQVLLAEPTYVGVQVQVQVIREPQYRQPRLTDEVRNRIASKLYYFLNPITGGFEQTGWPYDRPLSRADIIALLQKMPEVQYVAEVKLFSIRHYPAQGWAVTTNLPEVVVQPGKQGILCSWADEDAELQTGHVIEFVE